MSEVNKVNILGVNIACVNMKKTLELITNNLENIKGNYICVSNVHTTIMATENIEYMNIQNSSYLSLPDGKPLSIVGKIKGNEIDRVTGPDLMEEIFKVSEKHGYRHYFYGNTDENLKKLIDSLSIDYPKLKIVGYKPSVFRDLTDKENKELVEEINSSKADYIWIALGAPRQEVFMYNCMNKVNGLMIGVGGAFNVISGVSPRAPKWMQDLSLEWMFRLIDDPKRLWKRYFVTNSKFIVELIKLIIIKR